MNKYFSKEGKQIANQHIKTCSDVYRVSSWGDEKLLKLVAVIAYFCESTKNH